MAKFNFTRMQMRATTQSVNLIRTAVDFINLGINKVYAPIGRAVHKLNNDYPLFVVMYSGMFIAAVPIVLYPIYVRYIESSTRKQLERERVKLCLEKGIDPFPMIRYKEHVHGNSNQIYSFSPSDAPDDASYEHRAVENLRKKAELYAKVMGVSEGTKLDSASYEDPNKSLDSLLALRERERRRFNGNKLVVWQDPVDLAFPKRDDELYPTIAAERRPSPAEEKAKFREEYERTSK